MVPLKFLENMVILCFERRFSEQNSVIRQKSNIFPPKKILVWRFIRASVYLLHSWQAYIGMQ